MILRLLFALVAAACLATASSQARKQLHFLQTVGDALIRTPTHKVNALSHFDLDIILQEDQTRLRLSLEPNDDVVPEGATVSYLGPDGELLLSEPIDRLSHKVFKGTARAERQDGAWVNVGWARITVLRDGTQPLFEGAFSVDHDNHHIQLRSTFMRTRHVLDPILEATDDEYMVLFRDSDIASRDMYVSHTELKRDVAEQSCSSDVLEFNSRLDHPVYRAMMKRQDSHWGFTPVGTLFGKRQIDTQGSGNTAGVNLVSTIGQSNGCPSTRKVALVGIATDCGYTGSFNSTASAKANVITVMNAASAVWESTFNISLGLQNLTISDANCPGTVQPATPWNQDCDSDLDIQDRLNLFSAWRGSLADQNSHWTMMTKCNSGSTIGLAWLGQACVHDAVTSNTSTGSETISGANVVALTSTEWQVIAHETGHTYGAVHDCDSTTCTDNATVVSQQCCPLSSSTCSASSQYIMNPYTASGITQFSACTVGNICSAIGRNSVNTTCLAANKGVLTITGAQCGNGIVEEGEQCDCGGIEGCGTDPCCNPTTCKFVSGAVCDDANEDCCSGCQFAANGTVCRASSGTCDPAETCTGTTAICPTDAVAPDGQPCTLAGVTGLACASGQCTSRNFQCETVMAAYVAAGSANETYACDSDSCTLSCASPAFGPGTCYGLQQNLLDGTPCGGGGRCANGACKGSSLGKEVAGWIDSHKGLVIGLACGLGVLVLASCCTGWSRGRRARRRREKEAAAAPAASQWWYATAPPPAQMQQGAYPQTEQGQRAHTPAWGHEQQEHGWRPPPPPPPYNPAPAQYQMSFPQFSEQAQQQHTMLYGNGIIGSRAPQPSWTPPMPPPYPPALRPSDRYA